jgi:hypothetical protein
MMFSVVPIGLTGTNSGYEKRRAAGTSEEVLQQTSKKLSEAGVCVNFDYSMTHIIIGQYHTCLHCAVMLITLLVTGAAICARLR